MTLGGAMCYFTFIQFFVICILIRSSDEYSLQPILNTHWVTTFPRFLILVLFFFCDLEFVTVMNKRTDTFRDLKKKKNSTSFIYLDIFFLNENKTF